MKDLENKIRNFANDKGLQTINVLDNLLNHIDMNDFGTNRNGEGIKLNTTYRRTKQQN